MWSTDADWWSSILAGGGRAAQTQSGKIGQPAPYRPKTKPKTKNFAFSSNFMMFIIYFQNAIKTKINAYYL